MPHFPLHHRERGGRDVAMPPRTSSRRRLRYVAAPVAVSVAAALLPAFTAAGAAESTNLVVDPDFANGTGAWTVPAGVTTGVVSGYNGARAIRMTNTTTAAKTTNLNDKLNTVSSTTAGVRYSASAWVRVSAPGMAAGVREGEWDGSTSKGTPQVTQSVISDYGWHLLSVDYTAASSGATIDFNILGWQLPAGATVDVSAPSLTAAAPPAAPAPAPAPGPSRPSAGSTYTKLAFDDEFAKPALNPVWNVNNYVLGYELSQNEAKNVFVRDGDLIIAAKKEPTPSGRQWSSGYVDTRGGKFAQRYGFFEARIQLPTTAGDSLGLWPAWWLRPDGAKTGELDVMEGWGEGPNSPRSDYRPGSATSSIIPNTNSLKAGKKSSWWTAPGAARLSGGFHTFALEWSPAGFTFYLDGTSVVSYPSSSLAFSMSNFDAPFHLRLQMQVGNNYWGVPNSSTKTYAEMKVDWVRVWTK